MTDGAEPWILVVEDDPEMRDEILVPGLADAGFSVEGAGDAAEAYRRMLKRDYSLFVLDIGLPGEDGLTTARHLRSLTNAGIVMLTGRRRSNSDRIRGLDEGADAYVLKPFDMDLLVATVRSVLRRLGPRAGAAAPATPATGWRLEKDSWHLASPTGNRVRLSHAERVLVGLLSSSPGEAVARDAIISRLARDIHDFDPHRLEMLIHRLRRKVLNTTREALPLNAARGVGYVWLMG
ncbi:response regulator transcription factor [Lysobacter sp. CCNWLW3]|uniref:response regulator transcription factor n=1 Tax=unclassified Lysobacter TaxID=2635362 RepID=UPI002FD5E708